MEAIAIAMASEKLSFFVENNLSSSFKETLHEF
jgi:hypothetical protein